MLKIILLITSYLLPSRNTLKTAIFVLLGTLASYNSSAQTIKKITLTGSVIASETSLPIANAEVFVNKTTLKETTDSLGNFSIKFEDIPGILVVFHKDFELKTIMLPSTQEDGIIQLVKKKPSLYKLEVENNKKRKKDLDFFYSHFLTKKNKGIEILNDSVLFFIQNNKEFIAFSKQPLLIKNSYLGYKVKTILKQFHIHKEAYPNGPLTTLTNKDGMVVLKLDDYTYYEPVKHTKETNELYKQNRRKEYFGSQLHFLISMYYDNLEKAGFEVIAYPKNSIYSGIKKISKKLSPTSSKLAKSYMIQGDSLIVNYNHKQNELARYMGDSFVQTNINEFVIHTTGKIFLVYPNGSTANTGFIVQIPSHPLFNSMLSLPRNYIPYHQIND